MLEGFQDIEVPPHILIYSCVPVPCSIFFEHGLLWVLAGSKGSKKTFGSWRFQSTLAQTWQKHTKAVFGSFAKFIRKLADPDLEPDLTHELNHDEYYTEYTILSSNSCLAIFDIDSTICLFQRPTVQWLFAHCTFLSSLLGGLYAADSRSSAPRKQPWVVQKPVLFTAYFFCHSMWNRIYIYIFYLIILYSISCNGLDSTCPVVAEAFYGVFLFLKYIYIYRTFLKEHVFSLQELLTNLVPPPLRAYLSSGDDVPWFCCRKGSTRHVWRTGDTVNNMA